MAGAIADGELSQPSEQDQRTARSAIDPQLESAGKPEGAAAPDRDIRCSVSVCQRASRVRFEVAGPDHDAAIRRLLRESAMHGAIAITREREPSYFAGANIAGAEDETIVALERNEVIGIASCSIRRRYVNGELRRVGYVGELRLARSAQGRFDVLRRGFQFYAARHAHDPAEMYFTSIAADNERSRRFLERGLPGMPRYEFRTEFVTLLIRARRGPARITPSGHQEPGAIAEFLNKNARRYQLAAHWSLEQLTSLEQWSVSGRDFHAVTEGNRMVACAALWDQRPFRQTVIRGYSRTMRAMRPLVNLFSNAFGTPSLPPCGSTLPQAFLSPLASSGDNSESCGELIQGALARAAERGLEILTVGFAETDPRLAQVRPRFRCREYRTRLYRVRWPQFEDGVGSLDGRLICPEVSLL